MHINFLAAQWKAVAISSNLCIKYDISALIWAISIIINSQVANIFVH
jgi:hypothetical protein